MILSDDGVYEVTAVHYGRLLTTRTDAFLNYSDYDEPDGPIELAYYFWIIRNSVRTIVFDTGFSSEVGVRRGRDLLIDPRVALVALEVPDDEATIVVLSHAHYDHIGNVDWFRRASVVMAAEEYAFWVTQQRDQHLTRRLVEDRELAVLRDLHQRGRLELVSGSNEIAPGITIIPAPGHTPGELTLRIRTAGGNILLAADAVHFDEELDRRMPFRHMCDIVAAADSYQDLGDLLRTRAVSAVISGHQPIDEGVYSADRRLPTYTAVLTSSISHHERKPLVLP